MNSSETWNTVLNNSENVIQNVDDKNVHVVKETKILLIYDPRNNYE